MARRANSNTKTQTKKRDWRTTVWYAIGVIIVATMVFGLVATAFTP